MKKFGLVVATLSIAIGMAFSSFAGTWMKDTNGWWYSNDDGTYPNSGWTPIDGAFYYFQSNGYILTNTTTPDGYTVDANGRMVTNVSAVDNTSVQTANDDIFYKELGYGVQIYQPRTFETRNDQSVTIKDVNIIGADKKDYKISWSVIGHPSDYRLDGNIFIPYKVYAYDSNDVFLDEELGIIRSNNLQDKDWGYLPLGTTKLVFEGWY